MHNFIHINGTKFNAIKLMEWLVGKHENWQTTGLEFAMQMLDPSEAPVKFHTSGTTGIPKEIFFSKKQIFISAQNTADFFGITASSKLLLCMPTSFVAGRLMVARALVTGAELIWKEPSLNPLYGEEPISFAAFTPAQVASIIEDSVGRKKFEAIGTVIIGGGEISNALELELTCFGNTIFATYGMTETLTHVAVRKIGDQVYTSVYKEAVFSKNENGCLCISLPWISNELIVTKDMVELLSGSSFIWKGRLDNVINTGGVKLYAEELENKVIGAGLLEENRFYFSSEQDNIFGRAPVIVMLKEEKERDMAILLRMVNGLLNKHEAVKRIVYLDKFEYTETGKLKRQTF